jgi:hypothetical protein
MLLFLLMAWCGAFYNFSLLLCLLYYLMYGSDSTTLPPEPILLASLFSKTLWGSKIEVLLYCVFDDEIALF